MKVILVEDVKALGKKGEMVNVSDGYARNMLFPKKLALEASAKNINDLKLKKAHDEKVAKEQLADARAFAEELAKAQVKHSVLFPAKKLQKLQKHSLDMISIRRRSR